MNYQDLGPENDARADYPDFAHKVAKKVKELLDKSDNPSEMRYLEGLLILLGEKPGELEDPPDVEDDPDEYWQENDYFEV